MNAPRRTHTPPLRLLLDGGFSCAFLGKPPGEPGDVDIQILAEFADVLVKAVLVPKTKGPTNLGLVELGILAAENRNRLPVIQRVLKGVCGHGDHLGVRG